MSNSLNVSLSSGLLSPISLLLTHSRHQVSPIVSIVLISLKKTSAEELQLLRNFPKTTFPSLNEDSSKAEHFSDSQCKLVGQLFQGVFPQLSDQSLQIVAFELSGQCGLLGLQLCSTLRLERYIGRLSLGF